LLVVIVGWTSRDSAGSGGVWGRYWVS